jgi:hypothetical protein
MHEAKLQEHTLSADARAVLAQALTTPMGRRKGTPATAADLASIALTN